jgi:SAM-dependent methyltransferase
MTHYDELMAMASPAPPHWAEPCTHQECSLHQLSPYIGKLKSSIAQDLILKYSKPGELVADMFCGSGTVPLEAARLGRRVFASDASIYAVTLTQGKLQAAMTSETALAELEDLLQCVDSLPVPDLRCVPRWVRAFFHPHTLKEALRFTEFLQRERKYFLLASMLGILHHQRPGCLSFPSSHLVPYLRSQKFPSNRSRG